MKAASIQKEFPHHFCSTLTTVSVINFLDNINIREKGAFWLTPLGYILSQGGQGSMNSKRLVIAHLQSRVERNEYIQVCLLTCSHLDFSIPTWFRIPGLINGTAHNGQSY